MKQKVLLVLLCLSLVVALTACDLETSTTGETSPETETTETDEVVPTTDEVAETVEQEEKLMFELVAGEQGEYGQMITYNKGTEFEENFYAYYVPAGKYTVTNVGDYMSQFNVYSDEIVVNDAGWEEVAEAYFVKLIDVDKNETVTIEEGQHIEIAEPAHFKLEQQ